MTKLLIKRSLKSLEAGELLIRQSTGEKCRLLDIIIDIPPYKRYRFFGFDVLSPAMRRMFDLNDDTLDEYIPNLSKSYAAVNGQAASEKV